MSVEWIINLTGNKKNLIWIFNLFKLNNLKDRLNNINIHSESLIRGFSGIYKTNDNILSLKCCFQYDNKIDKEFIKLINDFSNYLKKLKLLRYDKEDTIFYSIKNIKMRCIEFIINNFNLYDILTSDSFSIKNNEKFIKWNNSFFVFRYVFSDYKNSENINFIRFAHDKNSFNLFILKDINKSSFNKNWKYDNVNEENCYTPISYEIYYENLDEIKYIESKIKELYVENKTISIYQSDDFYNYNFIISFKEDEKIVKLENTSILISTSHNSNKFIQIDYPLNIEIEKNSYKLIDGMFFHFDNTKNLFKKLIKTFIDEDRTKFLSYIEEYERIIKKCEEIKDELIEKISISLLI